MKISTSFNFGSPLEAPCDIIASVNIEIRLCDIWELPDVREIIAASIEPQLRHLQMSERSIAEQKERILLSGKLVNMVKWPYRYDANNHQIVDNRDETKKYQVSDWLEGRLPDL